GELFIGHRLRTALANALRCEQLDHIRTLFLPLPHQQTERVGIAASFSQWIERCQKSMPGDLVAGDRRAKGLVFGGPEALRGCDATSECRVRIAGDGESALELGLAVVAATVIATLRVEVPREVIVGVDQPGKE